MVSSWFRLPVDAISSIFEAREGPMEGSLRAAEAVSNGYGWRRMEEIALR